MRRYLVLYLYFLRFSFSRAMHALAPRDDAAPIDTVKVHIIHAVKFTSEQHKVQRHRWEKHEPEF